MSAALFASNARRIRKEREEYEKAHPESVLKEALAGAAPSDGLLEKTARERAAGVKADNAWLAGGVSVAAGSFYALAALAAGFSAAAIILPPVAAVGVATGAAYVLSDEKKAFAESLESMRRLRAASAKKACGYGPNPDGADKLANWRESRERACSLVAKETQADPGQAAASRAL